MLCNIGTLALFMLNKSKEHRENQTTIRLSNIFIVKMHMSEQGEKTLNKYINRLIHDDILHNGSEYVIQKYFKK